SPTHRSTSCGTSAPPNAMDGRMTDCPPSSSRATLRRWAHSRQFCAGGRVEMTRGRPPLGWRASVGLAVAAALTLVSGFALGDTGDEHQPNAAGRPDERAKVARCLTPELDRVFADLTERKEFQRVLGGDFAIAKVDAGGDRIEFVIEDAAHRTA